MTQQFQLIFALHQGKKFHYMLQITKIWDRYLAAFTLFLAEPLHSSDPSSAKLIQFQVHPLTLSTFKKHGDEIEVLLQSSGFPLRKVKQM